MSAPGLAGGSQLGEPIKQAGANYNDLLETVLN